MRKLEEESVRLCPSVSAGEHIVILISLKGFSLIGITVFLSEKNIQDSIPVTSFSSVNIPFYLRMLQQRTAECFKNIFHRQPERKERHLTQTAGCYSSQDKFYKVTSL